MSLYERRNDLIERLARHVNNNGGSVPFSVAVELAKQVYGDLYSKRYVYSALLAAGLVQDLSNPSNGHIYMSKEALAEKQAKVAKRAAKTQSGN